MSAEPSSHEQRDADESLSIEGDDPIPADFTDCLSRIYERLHALEAEADRATIEACGDDVAFERALCATEQVRALHRAVADIHDVVFDAQLAAIPCASTREVRLRGIVEGLWDRLVDEVAHVPELGLLVVVSLLRGGAGTRADVVVEVRRHAATPLASSAAAALVKSTLMAESTSDGESHLALALGFYRVAPHADGSLSPAALF